MHGTYLTLSIGVNNKISRYQIINGLIWKSFLLAWVFVWCHCTHFCDNIYSGFRMFLNNFTSIHGVYSKLQWFVHLMSDSQNLKLVWALTSLYMCLATITIFVLHALLIFLHCLAVFLMNLLL